MNIHQLWKEGQTQIAAIDAEIKEALTHYRHLLEKRMSLANTIMTQLVTALNASNQQLRALQSAAQGNADLQVDRATLDAAQQALNAASGTDTTGGTAGTGTDATGGTTPPAPADTTPGTAGPNAGTAPAGLPSGTPTPGAAGGV